MDDFTTENLKLTHNPLAERFRKPMGTKRRTSQGDHELKKADSEETTV